MVENYSNRINQFAENDGGQVKKEKYNTDNFQDTNDSDHIIYNNHTDVPLFNENDDVLMHSSFNSINPHDHYLNDCSKIDQSVYSNLNHKKNATLRSLDLSNINTAVINKTKDPNVDKDSKYKEYQSELEYDTYPG